MKLRQIIELLHAEIIVGNDRIDQLEVDRCFSADLMSDVLGRAHANGIMLTGVTNPQAIRTADIADIEAVCLVRGKQPEAETVTLAKQKDIPLFSTKFTMFEACGILYVNGLKGVAERQ
ncbi:MAG TPA: DRTGG domain-containing protein [Nitrospirota bacterium]